MSTFVHFVDVGQGNMPLLRPPNGDTILYDCNVTDENASYVLGYLGKYLRRGDPIDVFANSHRDADHMRGIKRIHERFPVQHVWDSGATGGSPECTEYKEYMSLRRDVGFGELKPRTYWDMGITRLRVLNSKNDDLPDNPNAQSIVIKVEHRHGAAGSKPASVMLTGDSDAVTWRDIRRYYDDGQLACSILLAGHHGSLTFFDDPGDTEHYFTRHLHAMSPAMTVISVGEDNARGHPHPKALEFYERYSGGSDKGDKIKRTDHHGSLLLELKDDGGWTLGKDG